MRAQPKQVLQWILLISIVCGPSAARAAADSGDGDAIMSYSYLEADIARYQPLMWLFVACGLASSLTLFAPPSPPPPAVIGTGFVVIGDGRPWGVYGGGRP